MLRVNSVNTQFPAVNLNSVGNARTNSSEFGRKKIRSPEYSSYNVRLSTFGRFPLISGVNVHTIAAAGFYYTGNGDIVRCYACDGGLKNWVPSDDPWEEHYKWFPDCSHLEQSNYKPLRREVNAAESNRKPMETALTSAERTAPSESLVRRQDKMTIDEEKTRQQEWDPDMNVPAVLAILDHGYSKVEVKKAITELRKKGCDTLTAMSILDVLLSYEDMKMKIPADDIEKPDPRDEKLEKRKNPHENELIQEIGSTKISNKNVIAEGEQKELGLLLEENEMLTSKMMCKRCRKRYKTILVLPCTHFCLCDQCSMEVSLCPECWKPIKERVKTYIS